MVVDEAEERETLRRIIDDIKQQFPDVQMEFSYQIHRPYSQLWVYVQTVSKYRQVEEYCKSRATETEQYPHPIWIFSDPWPGEFPGGASIEEIRRRREEFLTSRGLPLKAAHRKPDPVEAG